MKLWAIKPSSSIEIASKDNPNENIWILWRHVKIKTCKSCNIKHIPLTKMYNFNMPVFRRDVLWYGDVCPSGSPSVRLSVRVSVRPSESLTVRPSDSPSGSPSARFPHFSHTCFDILSWTFAHDFVLMYYKCTDQVEWCHFASSFEGVMPLCDLRI